MFITDKELLVYKSEDDLILDLMPGNYVPTKNESLAIARELVRAVNRYRKIPKDIRGCAS